MCNIQFGLKSPPLNINVVLIIIFPLFFSRARQALMEEGQRWRRWDSTQPQLQAITQMFRWEKKFNVLASSMNEAGVISCAWWISPSMKFYFYASLSLSLTMQSSSSGHGHHSNHYAHGHMGQQGSGGHRPRPQAPPPTFSSTTSTFHHRPRYWIFNFMHTFVYLHTFATHCLWAPGGY